MARTFPLRPCWDISPPPAPWESYLWWCLAPCISGSSAYDSALSLFAPLWLQGKSTAGSKADFLTGEPWAIQFPSGVNMQIGADSQDSSSINIMWWLVPHASPGALAMGCCFHFTMAPTHLLSAVATSRQMHSSQTNLPSAKLPS